MCQTSLRLCVPLLFMLLTGCAAYRTSSNVDSASTAPSTSKKVFVYPSGVDPGKKGRILQRVDISIKKLTLFHSDPTKDQANAELEKRAAALGCDAVVNVQYQSGIGLTTWGYMDAQGDCVKFE